MYDNSQRVRLELHAAKLTNVAGTFKTSDPYAVVTLLSSGPNEQPRVLGKTEVIRNSLNPRWITHFDLDYSMGQLTRVNIGVYDDDAKKKTHKPMGSAMFEVGQVLGTRGNVKAKQLRNGGTLFVRLHAAPSAECGSLHLKLGGHELKNVDGLFGKSNPFFELSYKVQDPAGGLAWQPLFRSQPVMNDLNPRWPACTVDLGRLCGGDLDQPVQFKLYDWQKNGKHTWMGTFETNVRALLAAVVAEPQSKATADISKAFHVVKRGKLKAGQIIVTEARIDGNSMRAERTDVSGQQQFSNALAAPAYVAAATPESALPSTPSSAAMPKQYLQRPPQPVHLPAEALKEPLPVAVSAPLPTANAPPSPPAHPSLEQFPVSEPSPSIVTDYEPLPPPMAPPELKPSFVDYLSGGLEIEMSIAIDFTGSNGDPLGSGSLHYMDPSGQLNDYEKAITAVGSILARYDSNQRFPVYGFGAKYNGQIQHCFQVGNDAELYRIPNVLDAYRNVFKSGLIMSGPTVFAEVINTAAAKARSSLEAGSRLGRHTYTLLLILTDGEVSDVNLTRDALHSASDAPLSVIIVGIGSADFSSMNFLDNFQANSGNKHRDICQFVEFNRYREDKQALTRMTLQEIPAQLVDYFWSRGIKPLPPIRSSQVSLLADAPTDDDVDLNLSFGASGEITLADYKGAVFDDSKYSRYPPATNGVAHHRSSSLATVESASLHTAPASLPLKTLTGDGTAVYKSSASIKVAGGPYVSNASTGYTGTTSTAGASLRPYVVTKETNIAPTSKETLRFKVQAPANSYPGMQLQVKNPYTGQKMIVSVPIGVQPGGTFCVP